MIRRNWFKFRRQSRIANRRLRERNRRPLLTELLEDRHLLAVVDIIPYLDTGYTYDIVPFGGGAGFEAPSFDDSAFDTGNASFGTADPGCTLNSTGVATDWPLNTDILLRKEFILPAGATDVKISVAIDNDVQVFVNGIDVSGGLRIHDYCPTLDSFIFSVPDAILSAGTNLIAVRGHDRGGLAYADIRVTADVNEPPLAVDDGVYITDEDTAISLSASTGGKDEYAAIVQSFNPVAFWNFNNGTGSTAVDLAGGDNPGAINGATFTPDGGGFSGQAGDFALSFDGNDVVNVNVASFGSTIDDDNQITISFWQFGIGQPQNDVIFHGPGANGREVLAHVPWGDSRVYWDTAGCCTAAERISGLVNSSLYNGAWNHWTFVKNGNLKEVYANGSLILSGINTDPLTGLNAFFIGADGATGNLGYTGLIDDFAIFDDALTSSEIANLYVAGTDGAGLLLNDSDPDAADVIAVVGAAPAGVPPLTRAPITTTSANGAEVIVQADGSFQYDPTNLPAAQALDFGETLIDTFTYLISDGEGNTDHATVTVAVQGVNATVASISDASVVEGGNLQFNVSMSNPIDVDTVITYSTADGSATTADGDYTSQTDQTLTIPAGQTSGTITVVTTSDEKVELNETVDVTLTAVDAGGRDVVLAAGGGTESVFSHVPEASDYTLVYNLAIPNNANFRNANPVPYSTDSTSSIAPGSFDRIAYYLELDTGTGLKYVYASMDAFTSDAGRIGLPHNVDNPVLFQQIVNNMNVVSNVPGIVTGSGITTGNIEFWSTNYGQNNAIGIPGASGSQFDFGDGGGSIGAGHGSFQIHNFGAGQTLFGYNDWGGNSPGAFTELGIGNNTGTLSTPGGPVSVGGSPDWTFADTANRYTVKNLQILVRRSTTGTGTILNDDFAPVADAGGPYGIDEGDSLILDASATTDADSASLTYQWDVDGDGDFDENITGEVVTLTSAQMLGLGLADGPDLRTVTVEASDGTNIGTAQTTLSINNVTPTLVLNPLNAMNENGIATLTGTITDPGVLDTFTLNINWGDTLSPNNIQTYHIGASSSGSQSFVFTHQYLDDNPTGTPFNTYTVSATVTDNDTLSGSGTTTVQVNNVAPQVLIEVDQAAINEDGLLTLTGSIGDVGSLDTHTVEIDWGDGSTSTFLSGLSSRYVVLTQPLSWINAEAAAVSMGGHLVAINSQEENDFVAGLIQSTFGSNLGAWIGINDISNEGTYLWSNGDPVTYTNWQTGEPNNGGGAQDFGWINFGSVGKWDDHNAGVQGNVFGAVVELDSPTFTVNHQYLDDNPTGTPSDLYEIRVSVRDDDTPALNPSQASTNPATVTLDWNAATDVNGNQFWESTVNAANSRRWNFGASRTPVAVSGSNLPGITAAYHFSSVQGGATMASWESMGFAGNNPTSQSATFEVTFRPDDLVGNHVLLESGGNTDGMILKLEDNVLAFRVQHFSLSGTANDTFAEIRTTLPAAGEFYHFVGTIDLTNDEVSVDLNGEYVETQAVRLLNTGLPGGNMTDWSGSDASGLTIAGANTAGGNPGFTQWTGDIARVRYFRDQVLKSSEATTSITVHNVAPVAADQSYTTKEDVPLNFNVLAGIDNSGPFAITDVGSLDTHTAVPGVYATTQGGAVTIAANGSATYSPPAGFPYAVPSGIDTFTYTVLDDDTGPDSATVSITVLNLIDVSGRVFNDLDNDGAYEPLDGDAGLAGVQVEVWNAALSTLFASTTTAADGTYYVEANLLAGSYKIVEVVDELANLGLLDGRETAGSLGGAVDNSQDSNQIEITVPVAGAVSDAVDYLFAEIEPSDLFGSVWRDFNNDGDINFGELGIDNALVDLTGVDDRGNTVSLSEQTAGGGSYGFVNLRPGTYAIEETQPAGFSDGQESLGEVSDQGVPTAVADPGFIDGNDRVAGIELVPGTEADHYNFGERPQSGAAIGDSVTATIGFWHNNNGEALIESLNGGPNSTQLGDWLAATFPDMYGAGAFYDAATGEDQDMNLAGKTNAEIADIFQYLHNRNKKSAVADGPVKVDAQVLGVTLAIYATSENLAGGNFAAAYGFKTSADGIAYTTFNVLDVMTAQEADDLGLTPAMDGSGNVTILDILLATNGKAADGLLYDVNHNESIDSAETRLRTLANALFTAINEGGDI